MSVQLGIYLLGARGNVATCVASGAIALGRELFAPTGLTTATATFADCGLAPVASIALGGCDVVTTPLHIKAGELSDERSILPAKIVSAISDDLRALDRHIDLIRACPTGEVPEGGYRAAIEHLKRCLRAFRQRTGAERIVVINLASTEPGISACDAHTSGSSLLDAVEGNVAGIATNAMLHALAAFEEDCAFVNFTPSLANDIPGLSELAVHRRLPHAGKDGKTGETLLKTTLGPMFAARNLNVTSWLANNYLGNNDGKTLSDERARKTKLASKNEALRGILGEQVHLSTDIGYAPDLGDWKTAMDLIHFEGFLGARMHVQFTWQGCDSALAAPLAIDLARLVERAWRAGEYGALDYLACYFKSPMGTQTHAFAEQISMLTAHAQGWK